MVSKPKKVPSGRLGRGAVVGAAAVKVGAKHAAHVGTRAFMNEESRHLADLENEEAIAKLVFDALCLLRGCALKAAQLLAMEIEILPEALRKELAKSASQVPPMNRALLGKVLRFELRAPPNRVFGAFDSMPFAAASLGQVHAAEDGDGRPLAVKVQYPGMAEGIKADFDLLKGVLTPTRYHHIFAKCFPVIRDKIFEELDYRNEAQNTRFFKEAFDPGKYVVPRVYEAYSTARVITTERVRGRHLEAWLKTEPSRAIRDHFGQRLVDFFHEAAFEHHLIHSDPNPGNFLFRDDGRLGVIDFGCCSKLRPEFVDTLSELLRGDTLSVAEAKRLHQRIGIHYRRDETDESYSRFMSEWVSWLREPYGASGFDFAENRDYFERGQRFRRDFLRYIDHYEGDFAYYGRTLHGVMRILQQLGAHVKMTPPF